MTICKTAYDTTFGKALSLDKTINAIKESVIKDNLHQYKIKEINIIESSNFLPLVVSGMSSSESAIPLFSHPLIVSDIKDSSFLALDTRMFLKYDSNNVLKTKNAAEYEFGYSRYVLNYIWVNGGVNEIKNSLTFAGVIFAQWLSEVISRRFALDPKDQMLLSIVTNMYYSSMFYENAELTEEYKQLLTVQTINVTKAPSNLVLEVVDKISPMHGIKDYCENVKAVLENIRLRDFNPAILYTIITMSWYGLNSKENIVIATEHVPTWVAICYNAITQRTYKNTTIAKIAEKYGKRGSSDEFIKNYVSLINSYQDIPSSNGSSSSAIMSLEDLEKVVF